MIEKQYFRVNFYILNKNNEKEFPKYSLIIDDELRLKTEYIFAVDEQDVINKIQSRFSKYGEIKDIKIEKIKKTKDMHKVKKRKQKLFSSDYDNMSTIKILKEETIKEEEEEENDEIIKESVFEKIKEINSYKTVNNCEYEEFKKEINNYIYSLSSTEDFISIFDIEMNLNIIDFSENNLIVNNKPKNNYYILNNSSLNVLVKKKKEIINKYVIKEEIENIKMTDEEKETFRLLYTCIMSILDCSNISKIESYLQNYIYKEMSINDCRSILSSLLCNRIRLFLDYLVITNNRKNSNFISIAYYMKYQYLKEICSCLFSIELKMPKIYKYIISDIFNLLEISGYKK